MRRLVSMDELENGSFMVDEDAGCSLEPRSIRSGASISLDITQLLVPWRSHIQLYMLSSCCYS
eukprot:m.16388 g.16388  ORF g.16388 m.16388 type:complete len:63 (+) comp5684_c0_seq2:995-1183(+)